MAKFISTHEWKIDGTVNLTAICLESEWHLATAIDGLIAAGLSREDAGAFANFAFADDASARGGCIYGKPEDYLTDEQWDRLA
ncbi:MAG: hypothetical protein IPJ41_17855 [Phycisphaerales bacterium]|nr:hypothetical protein [Phycisphaerales bacterium]